MDKEKTIDVLNTLIQINNDRIEGYETASKETEDADLATLFSQFTHTSQKCNAELITEVQKLGGSPITGTKASGKIYRLWMDFKALVTGNDRKAILNSCEYGEQVAIETYEDALDNNSEDISSEQQSMLKAQCELIKSNHATVKSLLETLMEEA